MNREAALSNKTKYITLLNVVAAVAVVTTHINNPAYHRFSSTARYWKTSFLIGMVLEFCVPVFFMITGATLVDYRERYNTKVYFKKRFMKTVVPFFAWSVFGAFFRSFILRDFELPRGGIEWINQIMGTDIVVIYWFFIPLFGVYLLLPVISAIPKEKRKTTFFYFTILMLFFFFVTFLNEPLGLGIYLPDSLNLAKIAGGYLFFVLVGYLLHTYEEKVKKYRPLIYVLGVLGFLVLTIGTYTVSMQAGKRVETYKGFAKLPTILYSVAIFTLGQQAAGKLKNKYIWRFLEWIAKYTFAIYLLHYYVERVVEGLFPNYVTSIIWRMFIPWVVIFVCIFITWLMRKVPLIRKLVP